jgi:hypothetical protein
MESIKLHFLLILPTVNALVTSFGKDFISYSPGPNAVLTKTNYSGHAEKLPLILHDLLLPLATECTDVGQFEYACGGIQFDPVTRTVDVQGTGIGETVRFCL